MVSFRRNSFDQGFRHVLEGAHVRIDHLECTENKVLGQIWYNFSIDFAKKPVLLKK